MQLRKYYLLLALSTQLLTACNNPRKDAGATSDAPAVTNVKVPVFNEDTAYKLVERVAAFGPRVPGTQAQSDCAAWLQQALAGVCDTVYLQKVTVKAGDGKSLPCYNLIGVINPKASRRILLLTHWDSRPWADQDVVNKDKPIIAADDGGSGVGVLLELARQIKTQQLPADLGIDILLEDVEDYGKDVWGEQSWCLGTQYWAKNPHIAGYKAEFGILLDMVGARNAQFTMEGNSTQYAPAIQQMIWQAANRAGYSSYFPFAQGPTVTDDHLPVINILGIKTVDIINLGGEGGRSFAPHWHTHQDNIQVIDKATLKAVGQTLLQVIYEQGPSS
jgi:glutaminyl-peptide cyclotransferase